MDTAALKKFAQSARRSLMEQVATKMRVVLAKDSLARREHSAAVSKLEALIQEHDEDYVVEKIAYIWFNRFSALRFMDVNHYTSVGIVSPVEGQSQPEILAEAKMGHIDPDIVPLTIRQRIQDLLGNKVTSANPQAEAYRLLLVAACNTWNQAMPFLFQKIDDYTELLLPEDLLSEQSILTQLRSVMSEESCQDVEIIGWLYQFYISEKKDEVFDGLKKNKKITPENIPAATQLFTPHWIVRYLVENSLGRLWMLNHPESGLAEQMDYYIKPEQPETDFLKISSPEEIKVCDPACGSGHMLVYAFDLLCTIYEEEGYDAAEIPAKILTHNLYGIEIDERAGVLAAFALTMKARSKQRNFFRQQIRPNVRVLEKVKFEPGELKDYMNVVGRDLFTMQLQNTLHQFEEADNFGSLIRPDLTDIEPMVQFLNAKNVGSDLFLNKSHLKVMKVLEQAEYLRSKYHVVVANPPYMGGSGMNKRLSEWVKMNYPLSKSDLFSVFMERCLSLIVENSWIGMINLPSWLFLSTFMEFREYIIKNYEIESLLHMGRGIFGIDWGSTAFIIKKSKSHQSRGQYFRLHKRTFQYIDPDDIKTLFLATKNDHEYRFNFDSYSTENNSRFESNENKTGCIKLYHRANQNDFNKIPGSPIAYWVQGKLLELFSQESMKDYCYAGFGIKTGNNELFMRNWFEVNNKSIDFHNRCNGFSAKWYPCNSGGSYRRWYGNQEYIVNYRNGGEDIESYSKIHGNSYGFNGKKFYFKKAITWSKIASVANTFRAAPDGFIFDGVGLSAFYNNDNSYYRGYCSTAQLKIMSAEEKQSSQW